ncbi:MAG TPA: LysR substrate-binding domain-containing protein [Methylovirgula sp.]|nr:LysR substrate-binding domain-containing protein [Methylovirgula sp.]
MLYDPSLLRSFIAISETRSFTLAAQRVNLTRSAVSLHIKRLEDQVGRRLLTRTPHLGLTEDGELLLSYARRILALHQEVGDRLGRQPSGLVRLGAPEYFDPATLASLLGQFSIRNPAVEVEISIGPDIFRQFEKGRLDLAVVYRELGEGEGIVLRRERRLWAAAQSFSLDLNAAVPLALFPAYCGWRQMALAKLDGRGRPWRLVVESAGLAGLLAAVEAGLAVSVLAQNNLSGSLKALGETDGLPDLPDFEYILLRKHGASAAAESLAEVIVDYFRLSAALREKRRVSDGAR